MILVLKPHITQLDLEGLKNQLYSMGFEFSIENNNNYKSIIILNNHDAIDKNHFSKLSIIESILPFNDTFKLAAKTENLKQTVINIKDHQIGGGNFSLIAGPCSIESREQLMQVAEKVSACGGIILRGGAFKPRTSPYAFQGVGEVGLKWMREAADDYNLLSVSEIMCESELNLLEQYVDILQIGARNMQNYRLLSAVGQSDKPILLKRAAQATYRELLMAAEYILKAGNKNIILCERGIRTFETYTRNTLDIAAVPILKSLTHLPIILDPSHAVGLRSAIPPLTYAALAAGADGAMIEIHPNPEQSISDAAQAIGFESFEKITSTLSIMGEALNRPLQKALCETTSC